MSNIQQFAFNNSSIRFIDGKPVANDVATVLGYADPAKTISTKVDEDNRSVTKMVTLDGKCRSVTVLEEAGIYQLIFGSKLPSAKAFQQWVFAEVLPSIRKTGSYSTKPTPTAIPFWYQRLTYDQKYTVVPNGYFSIFREVVPLVAELEACGYVLPDDAVPDISVGKLWANYLRSINIIVESVARRYPHKYPDQRGVVHSFCYPESLLPTFRQWFRNTYKTDHLYRYLKNKDKSALPAVTKIVAMLKAST